MKLRSIEKEAAACRKAFAKSKVGDLAWCVHHQVLIEPLAVPAEKRIKYILSSKAKGEQARRLREMRPAKGKLPAKLQKADADRQKADADRQKAYADWLKAGADPAVLALHAKECPGSAWNGKTIFPEEP